jgi:hypothetical protein
MSFKMEIISLKNVKELELHLRYTQEYVNLKKHYFNRKNLEFNKIPYPALMLK